MLYELRTARCEHQRRFMEISISGGMPLRHIKEFWRVVLGDGRKTRWLAQQAELARELERLMKRPVLVSDVIALQQRWSREVIRRVRTEVAERHGLQPLELEALVTQQLEGRCPRRHLPKLRDGGLLVRQDGHWKLTEMGREIFIEQRDAVLGALYFGDQRRYRKGKK